MTAAQASGKIKLYQSVVGGLLIINLPISYLFLKLGYTPDVTLYVSIGISIVALFSRLNIIGPLVNLNVLDYFKAVVFRIIPVSFFAIIFPALVYVYMQESLFRLLGILIVSIISVVISIYFVGLSRTEKIFMITKSKQFFSKIKF